MKTSSNRRAAKIETPQLAFGGWGDYGVWAEHGFTPKPKSDPGKPPEEEPETSGPEREEHAETPAPGRGRGRRTPGAAPARARGPRDTAASASGRGTAGDESTGTERRRRTRDNEAATGTGDETAAAARTAQGRCTAADESTLAERGRWTPHEIAPSARPRNGRRREAVNGRPPREGDATGDPRRGEPDRAGRAPRTPVTGLPRAVAPGNSRTPGEPPRKPLERAQPGTEDTPYTRDTVWPPQRERNVLPPEVIVTSTGRHRAAGPLDLDLAAVCRICQIPTSIAEVSAYLMRSLDATRALVQHGINTGLLVAEAAELGVAGRPPLALLHRVHQGLLRL